jgi:hypothetical protein
MESTVERQMLVTVVSASDFKLVLTDMSVYESEILAVVISDGEFYFPTPIYFNDPFSGVRPNGWLLLYDGRRLNLVSPMSDFVTLGWRPVKWWYYAQFDSRIPGGKGDDFKRSDEDIKRELEEYEYARQYMINQEKNPKFINSYVRNELENQSEPG